MDADPIEVLLDRYWRERKERDERLGRRAWKFPRPGRNPETGRPRCRVCGADCHGRRTSFCSDACRDRFWFCASPAEQRRQVYERDRGVCSYCGVNTKKVYSKAMRFRISHNLAYERGDFVAYRKIEESFDRWAEKFDVPVDCRFYLRHLWESHHVTAIAEGGGGEIQVGDLRTACWRCHPRLTAEMRRRMNGKGKVRPADGGREAGGQGDNQAVQGRPGLHGEGEAGGGQPEPR